MSVLLSRSNWLVADWVMKLLFEDCIEIANDLEDFNEIIFDINESVKFYTFLLNYSKDQNIEKLIKFEELIKLIIEYNKQRELKLSWDKAAFENYVLKLKELNRFIIDDIEHRIANGHG